MNKYICLDEWSIIENNFNPGKKRILESIMSQGNSYMGIRGNFEENYSSDSLAGSYLAGVYYPDKNRVGWWKIGYPNYYARIVNIANFIGINIKIDGEELDLAKIKLKKYKRILNMQNGLLKRNFTIETKYN